jgi:type II secretory pathway pseudopilin PulG
MSPDFPASWRSPRYRAAALCVLVLAAVASAGLLTWAAASRGEAEDLQAEREEVMSVSEQFWLRKETFGPDDLGEDGTMSSYRDRVDELLTAKLQTSFAEETQAAEQLVAQSGLESSADVYAAAVSSLDSDSAAVLVVGETTFRYEAQKQPSVAPFRYRVSLVKQGGEWLVDGFETARPELP